MNNSRYFSTQPSANAVPASQVMAMMPAQQGHMVAAGQPMMAYQPQQQMMMQPMYVPAPMQQQMMAPVQQQMQVALPNNVQPKLAHAPAQRQFTVTGVDNPNLLEVNAPKLAWQMTKQGGEGAKAYMYSYAPAGQIHDVSVKYNGAHVEGSPFQLVPKELRDQMNARNTIVKQQKAARPENVSVAMHPTNKHHLVASNVPDVDKLQFDTNMAYQLREDSSNKNTFHLQYDPRGEVHRLDVSYDGKPVRNGQFELVPKEQEQRHRAEQTMKRAESEYRASVAAFDRLRLKSAPEGEEEDSEEEQETAPIPVHHFGKPTRQVHRPAESIRREHRSAEPIRREHRSAEPTQVAHKEPVAEADIAARKLHMIQTAPTAYAPTVMASHQPMMVPQQVQGQQQQPMMMQPMNYGNMTPPMYQMMPQQQAMQQQQPRMYQQH